MVSYREFFFLYKRVVSDNYIRHISDITAKGYCSLYSATAFSRKGEEENKGGNRNENDRIDHHSGIYRHRTADADGSS